MEKEYLLQADTMDKKHFLQVAVEAARAGGKILLRYFKSKLQKIYLGKDNGDFFTNIDVESENIIIKTIRKYFRKHMLIAEESGITGDTNSHYRWIIDPLDGTKNYFHGVEYFCVAITLVYNNQPIVSVTYSPIDDKLYTAVKGEGAQLNGKRIRVSKSNWDNFYIVASDFIWRPLSQFKENEEVLNLFKHSIIPSSSVTSSVIRIHRGASALDLALVADGTIDCVFISPFYIWDVLAGILLVQEAGGTCKFDPDYLKASEIMTKKKYVLIAGAHKLVTQVPETNSNEIT